MKGHDDEAKQKFKVKFLKKKENLVKFKIKITKIN